MKDGGKSCGEAGRGGSRFMTPARRLGLKTEARWIVRSWSREHTEADWLGQNRYKGGRQR